MSKAPQSVRKTRARRVFGEFVSDNEDSSSAVSLCYTDTDASTIYSSSATNVRASTETALKEALPVEIRFGERTSSESTLDKENISDMHDPGNYNPHPDHLEKASRHQDRKTQEARTKRRDLVLETQRRINNATISVNETLNAARVARQIDLECRARQISHIRNQWKEEKEEAHSYHEEAEKMRHGLLDLKRQLSSKYLKARVQADTNEKVARLNAIMEETEFKSKVYREHMKTLKEEKERKRRESAAARAKLRQNHIFGKEKLQMIRLEEDQALFEERYETIKASNQVKVEAANARRQSFRFRNGDARRIREVYCKLKEQEQPKQSQSFELKFAAARDADAYKRKLEEERRLSLAARNKEGKSQRDFAEKLREQKMAAEVVSYELKWGGEKDAEAYKRQLERKRRESLATRNAIAKHQREFIERELEVMLAKEQESIRLKLKGESDAEDYRKKLEEERRRSLAGRNAYARNQRELENEKKSQADKEQHQSYEIKWAGERDVDEYKRKIEKERRESLALRNLERANHAKVMEELRDLALEKETESYILKWAGEKDAKAYLAKCEDERRKSLQFRNAEARRQHDVTEKQKKQALVMQQQDELLKSQCHQDVEEYKRKCSERDRLSLELRRKEANLQRLEEKRRRQEFNEMEQSNRAIEDGAFWDVVEYIKDCKGRRRMSLALRAKEKRQHRIWQMKQAEDALAQKMLDNKLKMQDRRAVEAAKREERKKIALDAIKHAGCTFNVNGAAALRIDN